MEQLWYVAQLKAGGARVAEENLLRQGFAVFSPKVQRPSRRRHRLREELGLLFPGYLFVRSAADAASWRSIGATLGVSRLVTFGQNAPSAVPCDVIEWLREQCCNLSSWTSQKLKRGDMVRVISGPFCDFMARVEKLPSRDRIYLLLEFMGRERRISIGANQVLPQAR
jgi:transcriptional antiterminator RfaH